MPNNVLPDEPGKEKNPAKSVIDSPKPKEPLKLRAFGDAAATRQAIYDNVLKSAQSIGPVANVRNTLTLENVKYADPEHISLQKQKEAVLAGKSLYRRLRGTWRLRDNETGKLLDEQHLTVAQVPYQTNRGTFIMNGSDYILRHQMRLNPGVFTRIKENGELEAHINVLPGKGVSHRYFLEPETGVFKINIGQAKLPLIPVLRAMGVTDKQLKEHWGPEILQANAAADDKRVIDKLYGRLVRRGDPAAEHPVKSKAVADTISKMELDPEVTERTLGFPHKNITPEAILATTKKLIHVSRGDVDPDDRDHLAFQTLYGPEDLLGERFAKDKSFLRQLLWRATTKGNLSHVQPGALTKQLHAALLHSGLGQAAEEINPGELLDAQTSVTRLGEGGIPNMEAVPDESRSVQPSHFCYDDDTLVLSNMGWLPWREVTVEHRLATLEDGKVGFRQPTAVLHEAYAGELIGLESKLIDYRVTPNHRMYISTNKRPDDWFFADATDVFGKRRRFAASLGEIEYGSAQPIYQISEPPHNPAHRGQLPYGSLTFQMADWCEFLGWYLAEGSVNYRETGRVVYNVCISQSNTANPEKCCIIAELLDRMGLNWYYNRGGKAFVFASKHIAYYLRQFGQSSDKYIPRYVFTQPLIVRKAVLEAMMLGDGTFDYRYTTSSYRLALDVHELGCSVGHQAAIHPMDSPSHIANPAEQPRWRVSVRRGGKQIVTCREQAQFVRNDMKERGHYREHYTGMIHCARVPGGLLYVMRNGKAMWSGNSFIDPIRTPESFKVGVDTRLASAARKGNDGRIYAPFTDIKSGKTVFRSPQDLTNKIIAFPGEMAKNTPYVSAQAAGATRFVPREDVDYELPHFENAFSPLGNMIPMKSAIKGQRMAMGSRYLAQALPLVARESPHVQGAVPGTDGKTSYEEHFAEHLGAVRAQQHGRVMKITPDEITVKYADGTTHKHELYNNFPYARKTFIHNEPVINVGDPIKPGQLLAKSNFTDDTGAAALGLNARIAFVPMAGANYEDAAVISESMRKRLASEHMYQHDQEWTDRHAKGKKGYISMFPGVYDRKILDRMDHKGVVMPGTEVKYGDPLILAAEAREISHSKVHRGRKASYSDKTQTWEHHSPGVVTDVVHSGNNTTVAVKSINDINVGDKLSNRYGGKGVVSMILPDDKMPHDGQGKPYELLLNPLGMISRINPAQIAEAVLGKITAKTGKKYKVEDFGNIDDLVKFAHDEAQKYGVKDKEPVFDPKTGRQIKDPFTGEDPLSGYQFMLKLHHMAECFDAKTEALTLRGWVPWPEVRDDDLLATVENGHLLYEQPLRMVRAPFKGDLYCYKGRFIDYAVTGNHRLYGNYYHRRNKAFDFEYASRIHGRRFRIPQFGFEPDAPNGTPYFRLGEHELDWSDFAELIGWWVSEGYAKVTTRRACVMLYQSQMANPEHFARLEWLAARLPFPWHYYCRNGRCEGIGISSRPLAVYLKQFGTHSYNKRLPRDLFDAPPEARLRALDAMMNGDGNRQQLSDGPKWRYTTTSKGLADDFQELCVRTGGGAVVHRCKDRELMTIRTEGRTRISKCRTVWECGVALARTVAQIDGDRNKAGFSRKKYVGMVYCAEMRTGLLYVRRNGKPMLSGNSKGQGRGTGAYTSEEVPAKGGAEGSKRIALLETNALLSHGATEVLRDAHLIRGQKNDQYWQAYMSGFRPPEPQVPFVYRKFLHHLQAAGINPVRDGGRMHIMSLTDRDVDQMAGDREIQNADTVDWKEGLKPRKGGLFDPTLTGGHNGTRWSYIKLHEPLPNPAFEEPIRRMLGLTQNRLEGIIGGTDQINGQTGPKAIWNALDQIDVKKEINRARAEIKSGRATARDAAVRRLGYLKTLDRLDMHPRDWVVTKVPVLPPAFRPVSTMAGSGTQLVSDPNYLYKEVLDANDVLKQLHGKVDDLSQERLNLYNAFKGAVGLGDPIQPKNQERRVQGILKHVFGSSPKLGTVQRQLLGATVDVVGRAVITPNPDFDMDQVGLPETKAWSVYQPFVIRRLVQKGVPRLEAVQAVKDKKEMAKQAIVEEMRERPVIISRAPVLHKFGIQAFWPRLVKGDVMQISPIVTKGFNADFDGDHSISIVYVVIDRRRLDLVKQACGVSAQFLLDRQIPLGTMQPVNMAAQSQEEQKMPFSNKVRIPVLDQHDDLYLFNLQDFPHAEHTKTSEGQYGPIDWYRVPEGVRVLAHGDNGRPTWAQVTIWSEHHGCPVELVNLRSGRQIITDNDPRAVYGVGHGDLILQRFTPAQAVANRVMVPCGIKLPENMTADDAVRTTFDSSRYDSRGLHVRLKPTLPLDANFGYLLGAAAGDGWADAVGNAFCLASITPEITNKINKIINESYDGRAPVQYTKTSESSYGESVKHTWSSYQLNALIAEAVGRKAEYKHLPPWFLPTPREFREGLFAGIMDTDGSISVSNGKNKPQLMANVSSRSLRLLQEISVLAMSLGIRGHITSSATPAGLPFWTWSPSNYDVSKWGGLHMVHSAKLRALRLVKVAKTPALVRHDLVPVSPGLCAAVCRAMPTPKDRKLWPAGQNSVYTTFSKAKKDGYITRETANTVIKYLPGGIVNHPDWEPWRKLVAAEDITWDQVESYEATGIVETGYDLTVPGYETFMEASGVFLSNTMNWHVPASEEAKREAVEKMLPSRNLFSTADFQVHYLPGQEYVGGLYTASAARDDAVRRPRVFATKKDAIAAYNRGEIDVQTPVEIIQH